MNDILSSCDSLQIAEELFNGHKLDDNILKLRNLFATVENNTTYNSFDITLKERICNMNTKLSIWHPKGLDDMDDSFLLMYNKSIMAVLTLLRKDLSKAIDSKLHDVLDMCKDWDMYEIENVKELRVLLNSLENLLTIEFQTVREFRIEVVFNNVGNPKYADYFFGNHALVMRCIVKGNHVFVKDFHLEG